jgi:glycerophosphoryl diester phosphodiesterase
MRITSIGILLFLCQSVLWGQIPFAHAHNDYEHDRPLLDALDQGFVSFEADIHLIDGELYVYHDHPEQLDPERTLKNLYLDPLMERVKQNGGWVYHDYKEPVQLLVDLKTEGESAYEVLAGQLKKYRRMLCKSKGDQVTEGAVMIVLSGNRPMETVRNAKKRLVALDGRPGDLGKGYSVAVMPLISDHYRNQVQWNGDGLPPSDQLRRLKELARAVHDEGKTLRLWASPEKETVWQFLLRGGVDYLNTDLLKQLHEFATTQQNDK